MLYNLVVRENIAPEVTQKKIMRLPGTDTTIHKLPVKVISIA